MYKIVITGPESAGKTTLAKQLAEMFGASWLPEFAREYIGQLNRPYVFEDLKKIAKGQLQSEDLFLEGNASEFVFFDTDLLTIKIWSEDKFKKTDVWILNQIQNRNYDFYLLCKPDLPWEFDEQREDGERLDELFEMYKNELLRLKKPFAEIGGKNNARLERAIRAILEF